MTAVQELHDADREQELAGMLGALTDKTRASAREMLAASDVDKGQAAR